MSRCTRLLYLATPVSAATGARYTMQGLPEPYETRGDPHDPQAFRPRTSAVHATRLESFEETATLWNGHRVFAVEDRTFNLPP